MLAESENGDLAPDIYIAEVNEFQLMIVVHHQFARLANQRLMSTLGITFSHGSALLHMAQRPNVSLQGLAAFFGCGAGRISRLVHDLENRGFVSTWRGRSDRRTLHLALTPTGTELVWRVPAILRQAEQQMLSNLAGHDRERLLEILAGMVVRLDRMRG